MRLKDKVTIITGAGGGLGRAMAPLFGREGAKLVLVDVDSVAGEGTLALARAQGIDAVFLQTDVTNGDSIRSMVDTAMLRYGRIDGLVNIAGMTPIYPLLEMPPEVWDQTFTLNVKSHFLMARQIVPKMVAAGGGAIVNIGSTSSLRGSRGTGIYGASKAAVNHLTRSLCVAYRAKNIRVNCMVCGGIDNEHAARAIKAAADWSAAHPDEPPLMLVGGSEPGVRRFGTPEEYANVALFLLSDDSSWVNGATIVVDGGGGA